jgi:hypothetical protein
MRPLKIRVPSKGNLPMDGMTSLHANDVVSTVSDEVAAKAKRAICSNATDCDDAIFLLDMLGLLPDNIPGPFPKRKPRKHRGL